MTHLRLVKEQWFDGIDENTWKKVQEKVKNVARVMGVRYRLSCHDEQELAGVLVMKIIDPDNGYPDLRKAVLERNFGLLFAHLERDAVNLLVKDWRRSRPLRSIEEGNDDSAPAMRRGSTPPPRDTDMPTSYTTEQVELLGASVVDSLFFFGGVAENTPDPDMPREQRIRSTGGTVLACVADMRRAWREADLTDRQREAFVLRYGSGYNKGFTEDDTGLALGISSQQAGNHARKAVAKMTAYLNGLGVAA